MWQKIISLEQKKLYFQKKVKFLQQEYLNNKIIYPDQKDIFAAFRLTPFEKVKVVLLGQDPYHGPNQAHGLSFSVKSLYRPPSLNNIFKELNNDLQVNNHKNDLTSWALQGVLLLNAILTVQKGQPLSHHNIGWQEFTKNIFKTLQTKKNIVYLLWGNFAQNYQKYIIKENNYIIKSSHPSPLSAFKSFFGSKPFSKINIYLKSHGIKEINWVL
ncbi:uracil-DNA glycosylase [Candidatus Phytoplasma meliae]|uniref:Uracil-DNA glycosylase n=1 Tax=Candidatus Phytoplasma meliae TaxID=1848402 RepID=A0ABS5CY07_9MOLU|nr:uracil-DNA glycosylase [Candidatus Phytoplasma meliae]MBP5835858.1 uracil-DNA glycosylase [Candidatus Phytoplasma meliae]